MQSGKAYGYLTLNDELVLENKMYKIQERTYYYT